MGACSSQAGRAGVTLRRADRRLRVKGRLEADLARGLISRLGSAFPLGKIAERFPPTASRNCFALKPDLDGPEVAPVPWAVWRRQAHSSR